MSSESSTSEPPVINVEETISETRNEILTLYTKLGNPEQHTHTRFIKEESPVETRPIVVCPDKDCDKILFTTKAMNQHIKKCHPTLVMRKRCSKCKRPY